MNDYACVRFQANYTFDNVILNYFVCFSFALSAYRAQRYVFFYWYEIFLINFLNLKTKILKIVNDFISNKNFEININNRRKLFVFSSTKQNCRYHDGNIIILCTNKGIMRCTIHIYRDFYSWNSFWKQTKIWLMRR